ncbi:hypothetical protein [Streptomyces sp. NPDC057702]|uniref:hypothetical protein n=1 Tax=unclassified Streptomyces TaxID=2593676 RepID=UPI0036CE5930
MSAPPTPEPSPTPEPALRPATTPPVEPEASPLPTPASEPASERADVTDARARVLTGEHTVRMACGAVLRFFLADAFLDDPACGWVAVADVEFQLAYEMSLFERHGAGPVDLRPNARRCQVGLDALAGPGSFFWSDGDAEAGVMTTNGLTPDACGLTPASVPARASGGAA